MEKISLQQQVRIFTEKVILVQAGIKQRCRACPVVTGFGKRAAIRYVVIQEHHAVVGLVTQLINHCSDPRNFHMSDADLIVYGSAKRGEKGRQKDKGHESGHPQKRVLFEPRPPNVSMDEKITHLEEFGDGGVHVGHLAKGPGTGAVVDHVTGRPDDLVSRNGLVSLVTVLAVPFIFKRNQSKTTSLSQQSRVDNSRDNSNFLNS